jgi:hypothetical protein
MHILIKRSPLQIPWRGVCPWQDPKTYDSIEFGTLTLINGLQTLINSLVNFFEKIKNS